MVFDLIGWSEALPGVAQQNIAAGLNDQFTPPIADLDGIQLLPRHSLLLGVFAAAVATGAEARFIQADYNLDKHFAKVALIAGPDPITGYTDLFANPLPIKPSTALWAASVNAASEDTLIGALVGDKIVTEAGRTGMHEESIHGVSATLWVANTWTFCPIVWDQAPPQGRYAVVGMRGGVNGAAALNSTLMRIINPGATDWRPGVPCTYIGGASIEFQATTYEPWARWPLMPEISFMDTQLPNVECLSPGANTTEIVELKLIRLGDS